MGRKSIDLLSPSYQRKLRKAFIGANLLLMLFGVAQIICVIIEERLDKTVINFLQTNTDYNDDHIYLLYSSSGLIIISGFIGLFSAFFDCALIFDSYDSILHIAFALTMMAGMTPELISTRPDQDELEAIFKAETFHHAMDMHHRDIWGEMMHNWLPLQESLQCCGVNDFRDWLFSEMASIPVSCCNRTHMKECKPYLVTPDGKEIMIDVLKPMFEDEIYPLITQEGCLTSLQTVIMNVKSRWIKYPLIFVVFQFIIMGWSAYFAHMVRLVSDTINDLETLHNTHHKLKLMIQEADEGGEGDSHLDIPDLFISRNEREVQGTESYVDSHFVHRKPRETKKKHKKRRGRNLQKWDAASVY